MLSIEEIFLKKEATVERKNSLICKFLFKKKNALQRDWFLWVEGLFPSKNLHIFNEEFTLYRLVSLN